MTIQSLPITTNIRHYTRLQCQIPQPALLIHESSDDSLPTPKETTKDKKWLASGFNPTDNAPKKGTRSKENTLSKKKQRKLPAGHEVNTSRSTALQSWFCENRPERSFRVNWPSTSSTFACLRLRLQGTIAYWRFRARLWAECHHMKSDQIIQRSDRPPTGTLLREVLVVGRHNV